MSSNTPVHSSDPLNSASQNLDAALHREETRTSQLRASAVQLQRALRDHIHDTESATGFLAEMQTRAPRLAPKVSDLCAEHKALNRELDRLIKLLLTSHRGHDLDSARELARRIRREIREHQSRANDLFFQAFCVDIGPCD